MKTHNDCVAEEKHRMTWVEFGERMEAERAQDAADAARWRYVRDNMTRSDPKMDGTSYFFFKNPVGRGKTVEGVIDRRIEEQGS